MENKKDEKRKLNEEKEKNKLSEKGDYIFDNEDNGEISLFEYAKVEILCNTVVPKGAMQRTAYFKSIDEKIEYDENIKKLINEEITKIKQSKSKEDIKLSKDIYHVEKISKEENGVVKKGVRFVSSINKQNDDLMEMTSVALLFDVPDSQGWVVKDRNVVVEASKNFLNYGDKKLKFTHEKDEYGFPYEIDANTIEVYLAKETDEYFGDIPNSLIFVTKFNDKNMWDFVKKNNWETSIELWAIEKNYKEKKKSVDMDKNIINFNTEEEKSMYNIFKNIYNNLSEFFNKKNVKESIDSKEEKKDEKNTTKKEDNNMEEKDEKNVIETLKSIVEEIKSLKDVIESVKNLNEKKEEQVDKKENNEEKEDEITKTLKSISEENNNLKEKIIEMEKTMSQIDLNLTGQLQSGDRNYNDKNNSGFVVNYNSKL